MTTDLPGVGTVETRPDALNPEVSVESGMRHLLSPGSVLLPVLKAITTVAWVLFALTNALMLLLLGMEERYLLISLLLLLLWGLSFGALGWLLIYYNRTLAQWRAVLLAWLGYCGLRLLAIRLYAVEIPFVQVNLTTFVLVMAINAFLVGLFAIVALAIRRDVSVAYIVIFFAFGPTVLLRLTQTAGGVQNLLFDQMAGDPLKHFSFAEPILLGSSCMAAMGFLTLLPHLIWLGIKELRGH